IRHQRLEGSWATGLRTEGFFERAAAAAGVPAVVRLDGARRRRPRGTRPDLGTRQNAAAARRLAQLVGNFFCPYGQSLRSGQMAQCGSRSVHVAEPWLDRYRNARRNVSASPVSSPATASRTERAV